MKRVSRIIVLSAVAVALLAGCRSVRFSEAPAPKIGERSDDDRQRRADEQAARLGQKPAPVNYTRN